MDEIEMLTYIPRLYFMKGRKSKYELVKEMKKGMGGRQYKIIKELIDLGFVELIEDRRTTQIANPPSYEVTKPCKERMWEFLQRTPIGELFLKMIKDNKVIW